MGKTTEAEVQKQRRELAGIRNRLGAAEEDTKTEFVRAKERIQTIEGEISTLKDELEASQSAMVTAEASAEVYLEMAATERQAEVAARDAANKAERARNAAEVAPLPELPVLGPPPAPVRKAGRLASAPVSAK